jgi:hypothetical protein
MIEIAANHENEVVEHREPAPQFEHKIQRIGDRAPKAVPFRPDGQPTPPCEAKAWDERMIRLSGCSEGNRVSGQRIVCEGWRADLAI